ncbi:MAG: hypothetical protein CML84_01705 [Rhodobiaceae bacterium]|nr:hypothetical protein [Rhodobiaceae bacterium]
MTDQISSNIINSLKLSRSTLFYLALAILLGCLTYLSFAEKKYQSYMVIIPETNGVSSAESVVSSAISSFGSLGGGLDLGDLSGGSEDPQFKKVLYLINSIEVSRILIDSNPELIQELFPKKTFNIKTKKFKDDNFFIDVLKSIFGMKYINNEAELIVSDRIKKILKISKESKSKFTVLSIDNENPKMAKELLENIYKISEDIVKKDTRDASLKKIKYFETSLATGNLSSINSSAFTKMANIEYQKFALSSSDAPFASQIVQKPTIDGKPVSPNIYLVIFVSLVIWLVISTLVISIRYDEENNQ